MSITIECPQSTLYFRQGSSDKIYQIRIEPSGPGFAVNFAYGRRGSTLQTGTKTSSPVGYDEAVVIYDKLVREKTAKGYSPGESGTPYHHTEKENRTTGIIPQLLNAIDEERCNQLLTEPAWWAQEKVDGKRILIRRTPDDLSGINRSGLIVDLPETVSAAVGALPSGQFVLDGECMGDRYVVFDLLELACVDTRSEPYADRFKALKKLITARPGPVIAPVISLVDTAATTVAKRTLLAKLRSNRAEGIVFKRHDAVFSPGRPASGGDQLKYKFVATASCIVAGSNGSRRSVRLELVDTVSNRNTETRVAVGSVTIPANQVMPVCGQVVEARYLYAYPGGSLFQPVYLGIRDDITAAECRLSQLKFKRDDAE